MVPSRSAFPATDANGGPKVLREVTLFEPRAARGLGLGSRLVDEVVQFARQAGYKKITLWTQRELTSARKIYKAAGFELVAEEEHQLFGNSLMAETWEMRLTPTAGATH